MIRFDVRNKKPDLFKAIYPCVVAVLACVIVFLTSLPHKSVIISFIIAVVLVIVIAMLVDAFIKQLEYNPYSYNTIYYVGFALFLTSVLISLIIIIIDELKDPQTYAGLRAVSLILGSARSYMLYSAPFVLIFSVALCISNIALIRHEGKSLANILGIILSFLMVAGEVFIFTFDYYASGSQLEVMRHDIAVNFFSAVYLYYECMLIGSMIANFIVIRYVPDMDKDFMIILGCGIAKDGTPLPLLRGRIEKALSFYNEQKEKTGKSLRFICSGGQGSDEVISEALSMKNYLLTKGIKEEEIILEDKSTNTYENMAFSKKIIDELDPEAKVAFATTKFHVFRSGLNARKIKMRAIGIGSDTKWYFWPNATVREFVGLLTEHRLKQAIIAISMILFYVLLTIVQYTYL